MASAQAVDNSGLVSVQEPDGVSLRVVATIAASPVTPCLVFQESLCLLVGQFYLWLLEVAAGLGKTVCLLVARDATVRWYLCLSRSFYFISPQRKKNCEMSGTVKRL